MSEQPEAKTPSDLKRAKKAATNKAQALQPKSPCPKCGRPSILTARNGGPCWCCKAMTKQRGGS